MEELRNSQSYIDAYAKYIKTGKDKEIRAMLTENVEGGQIPVPEFVYDTVKTAWEDSELLSYIRKLNVKGNLKVGYEISSTGAVEHPEGAPRIEEEQLLIGVVELIPQTIKKYVMLSDELEAMASRDFLMYVYDELTHQIARKLEERIINDIVNPSDDSPEIGVLQGNPEPRSIALVLSKLCAEAKNPVAIMNRGTWGSFKKVQYDANFSVDVFEKLTVIFCDVLPSYEDAQIGEKYLIVGDFSNGALLNYPEGEEIRIKRDDITLATQDLVRYVGRVYCAFGVIAPKHFAVIEKLGSEGRTKWINENGTFDVSDYRKAVVNVTNVADEKQYLIREGTTATSMEFNGMYGIFLPNAFIFAPTLYFNIDGVEYETVPYAMGSNIPSNTITFSYGEQFEHQLAVVTRDYMNLGQFSGTGIITPNDTEPTEHTISAYYKGPKYTWQVAFVSDLSQDNFKGVYINTSGTVMGVDVQPDHYTERMGMILSKGTNNYVTKPLDRHGTISNLKGATLYLGSISYGYDQSRGRENNLCFYDWTFEV